MSDFTLKTGFLLCCPLMNWQGLQRERKLKSENCAETVTKQTSVSTWLPLCCMAIGTGFLSYTLGKTKSAEMGSLAKPACHRKSWRTKTRSHLFVSSFYSLSSRFVWLDSEEKADSLLFSRTDLSFFVCYYRESVQSPLK